MIRKKITRFRTTPKVYVSIEANAGMSRQTYEVTSGTYYPDRSLVPLVLTPRVGYRNVDTGEAIDNANNELTEGRWYRLDNNTTGGIAQANLITPDTPGATATARRYEIDTTPGSSTYGQLKIYENTDPGNPVTYVFVAKFGVGTPREVTQSFRCVTDAVETIPVLTFDNSSNTVYNPLEDPAYFDIMPSVPGYQATYLWESSHGGAFAALGSSPLDWAVQTLSGGGIRIDRSVMQSELKLRCTATVAVGSAQIRVSQYVTHTRRLPRFWYDITRVGQISDAQKTLNPYALISTSRGLVGDDSEVMAEWYGGAGTLIATGLNPSVAIDSLGVDMDLGLNVADRGGWCALQDSDGAFLADFDGALLIAREY